MTDKTDEEIQSTFKSAQRGWADALRAHRLAPPDAGYSARLLALCRAAHAEALICWEAHDAGYKWGSPVDLGVNHRCGRVIWMPEQVR
jgi:hypothetical protein